MDPLGSLDIKYKAPGTTDDTYLEEITKETFSSSNLISPLWTSLVKKLRRIGHKPLHSF